MLLKLLARHKLAWTVTKSHGCINREVYVAKDVVHIFMAVSLSLSRQPQPTVGLVTNRRLGRILPSVVCISSFFD